MHDVSTISELSEGQSNQAETSTAARHGTMIVSADQPIKGSGGSKVEYLSDRTGIPIGRFKIQCFFYNKV